MHQLVINFEDDVDALFMLNNHDMQSHRNKFVGFKSGYQAGQATDPPLPVPLSSKFSLKKKCYLIQNLEVLCYVVAMFIPKLQAAYPLNSVHPRT